MQQSSYTDFDVLKAGDTDPTLDKVIKEVILTSNTFIVYMDENDVIQWSATNHSIWGINFGQIQNEVSYWESICNKLFNNIDSYNYKCLLAEAYARMLDQGDDDSAQKIIDDTIKRIKTQGKEILRQQYIFSGLITTFLVIVVFATVIFNKNIVVDYVSYDGYDILLMGLLGGVGAFLSTMIRAKNYEADIIVGKGMHRIDGFLRIIYGLLAGVIVSLGIKGNIIFGFLGKTTGGTDFKEFFIAIVSGASETVLPNIIKKVESKT